MRMVFVLLLASLIVMLTMSVMFSSVVSADDKPYLKFTITQKASRTGTLTFYNADDTVNKSWSAISGKENKGPDYEYVGFVGPIPHGNWDVTDKSGIYWRIEWGGELVCDRDNIHIHPGTISEGCIVLSQNNFTELDNLIKDLEKPITLKVVYPNNAYNCDPRPKGEPYCERPCAEGPNATKKCYSPTKPEPEDGCCNWSGSCYDGTHPPDKCDKCYGGSWHEGWWCEEGECVPEASTLVLLATGLLFLAGYLRLRRKEN